MSNTLLIWFNPDTQKFEQGTYPKFQSAVHQSFNQDRFEILYEYNLETITVADKILTALNTARTNSYALNF